MARAGQDELRPEISLRLDAVGRSDKPTKDAIIVHNKQALSVSRFSRRYFLK